MRVLVGCEFSGRVRDAFIRRGHDAVSCDLLPSESPDGPHYQGDIFDIVDDGFDLLIAHPPCTFLANSGVRWLRTREGRWDQMLEAVAFFKRLLEAPVPRIAVENPVMHFHAADRIGSRATQFVQPWQFGHFEIKATGFHLKGLPLLEATDDVGPAPTDVVKRRKWAVVHQASPGPNRWKDRSRTCPGIAEAMAAQWGSPACQGELEFDESLLGVTRLMPAQQDV